MNYDQSAGLLILGSRLRRLSELFLATVNTVYREQGIVFETGWFPVFFLLNTQPTVTITAISETMRCSQPTASQLVRNLKEKGLITAVIDPYDARSQQITLTPDGQVLLHKVLPVWEAMQKALDSHFDPNLLEQIAGLEQLLEPKTLADKIKQQLS